MNLLLKIEINCSKPITLKNVSIFLLNHYAHYSSFLNMCKYFVRSSNLLINKQEKDDVLSWQTAHASHEEITLPVAACSSGTLGIPRMPLKCIA